MTRYNPITFLVLLSALCSVQFSFANDHSEPIEEEASECFSIQPHISDAWCQAVECDPVYADFCATETEEVEVEVEVEIEEALPPQCVSFQPHISDAWCEAVACAPVFVEQGICGILE